MLLVMNARTWPSVSPVLSALSGVVKDKLAAAHIIIQDCVGQGQSDFGDE